MSAIDNRLKTLGITLPTPVPPVANYVPSVISGKQLVISGQICAGLDGKVAERHVDIAELHANPPCLPESMGPTL